MISPCRNIVRHCPGVLVYSRSNRLSNYRKTRCNIAIFFLITMYIATSLRWLVFVSSQHIQNNMSSSFLLAQFLTLSSLVASSSGLLPYAPDRETER